MVYNFDNKIVNRNSVNDFYKKNSFVGYILPNGEIYECKEHNVSNIDTVLTMDLELLINHFNDKDKILKNETQDKLLKIVTNYLYKASYEKLIAISKFIKNNNLFVSDLVVQLFGCHLVTRLDKTIITSEVNHSCFFNYLLNDFKINTIDKIVYDDEKKEYKYVHGVDRNDYLYDEVEKIKESVNYKDIDLFYRGK